MRIMFTDIPGVYTTQELMPYETETSGSIKYWRYTNGKQADPRGNVRDEKEIIFKQTTEGSIVRIEKAWDLWANRASAKYIPVNSDFGEKWNYNTVQ